MVRSAKFAELAQFEKRVRFTEPVSPIKRVKREQFVQSAFQVRPLPVCELDRGGLTVLASDDGGGLFRAHYPPPRTPTLSDCRHRLLVVPSNVVAARLWAAQRSGRAALEWTHSGFFLKIARTRPTSPRHRTNNRRIRLGETSWKSARIARNSRVYRGRGSRLRD